VARIAPLVEAWSSASLIGPVEGSIRNLVVDDAGFILAAWNYGGDSYIYRYSDVSGWASNFILPGSALQEMEQDQLLGNAWALYRVGDSMRLDRYAPAEDVFENLPPVADAGPDQTVSSGEFVQLDGSASYDVDGHIAAYEWLQVAGPATVVENSLSAIARFNAGSPADDITLSFELNVIDEQGEIASDTVNVTVLASGTQDAYPPETQISAISYSKKGNRYYEVELSVNEIASTWFRLSGQGVITSGGTDSAGWQPYAGVVTVALSRKGSATFEYYSVDASGNEESPQMLMLQ
jgi:hypothetical protein